MGMKDKIRGHQHSTTLGAAPKMQFYPTGVTGFLKTIQLSSKRRLLLNFTLRLPGGFRTFTEKNHFNFTKVVRSGYLVPPFHLYLVPASSTQ